MTNALEDFRRSLRHAGVALPRRPTPTPAVDAPERPQPPARGEPEPRGRPVEAPRTRTTTQPREVRLIPLERASRYSGMSTAELRELVKRGHIRAIQAPKAFGGALLLRADDLGAACVEARP